VGSVAVGLWAVYVKFYANGVVPGWTTIMMMVAFSASVQLMVMGILGEYVGRLYEEVKARPLYVVAEQINMKDSGPPEVRPPAKLPAPRY
jgi:hypothetical protein